MSDVTSSGAGGSADPSACDALGPCAGRVSDRAGHPDSCDALRHRPGYPLPDRRTASGATGPAAILVVAQQALAFVGLPARLPHDLDEADRVASAAADRLCDAVIAAERGGARRAEILGALQPVRTALARSPVLDRMQRWPRGYRGDFETVDDLVEGEVGARPWDLAWFVERHVRASPLLAQHRNRSAWVSAQLRSAIHFGGAVLSLCSGSAAEIAAAICVADGAGRDGSVANGRRADAACTRAALASATVAPIVVHDFDPTACDAARRRIGAHAARCRFIAGPLADSLERAARFGPYAVIVSLGLLDHVGDAAAIQLLSLLGTQRGVAGPGTRICLANTREDERYRFWLEYLVDWPLVARSRERLERVLAASRLDAASTAIGTDATGLAWLVEARSG